MVTFDKVLEIASEFTAREERLPARVDPVDPGIDFRIGSLGRPIEDVVDALRNVMGCTPSPASPHFLNQLFGGRDAVATMAEMLTPVANTSMYTYKVAGPHVLVEREVLRHMLAKASFTGGWGIFTPGGSMANLTALLVARNERVPDIRQQGIRGRHSMTVYTSSEGHYSTVKNAGILGIGRANVRLVPSDNRGRMKVQELERLIRADLEVGHVPVMINATAGTTVLGAFDPLNIIAEVAMEHGVWFHVDGALGGSVLLSRRHRHLLDGLELADSFTWNAHKMMGVPLPCSVVLMKRGDLLSRNLTETADYLFQADESHLNPGEVSLQCGRRNDALKLWAAWLFHGDEGYDARIGRMFELARYAADSIEADPGLTLLLPPESVNVCFEVNGSSSAAICERLDTDSKIKIGHGMWKGRCAIRLVTVNPDLCEADIDHALTEIKAAAEAGDGGERGTGDVGERETGDVGMLGTGDGSR